MSENSLHNVDPGRYSAVIGLLRMTVKKWSLFFNKSTQTIHNYIRGVSKVPAEDIDILEELGFNRQFLFKRSEIPYSGKITLEEIIESVELVIKHNQ